MTAYSQHFGQILLYSTRKVYAYLPKFANIPVTHAKAKLAAGVLTATYAKRNAPVTIADRPIIQRRPKKVFTRKAAERGPTTPTADSIQ